MTSKFVVAPFLDEKVEGIMDLPNQMAQILTRNMAMMLERKGPPPPGYCYKFETSWQENKDKSVTINLAATPVKIEMEE